MKSKEKRSMNAKSHEIAIAKTRNRPGRENSKVTKYPKIFEKKIFVIVRDVRVFGIMPHFAYS